MPAVISPMTNSTLIQAANRGFRVTFDDLSLLMETFEFGVIDGWGYVRAVPLGGRDLPQPPPAIMRLLIRAVPTFTRRVRACERTAMNEQFVGGIDRWFEVDRPRLQATRLRLLAVDLAALTDAELASHLREARLLLDDALEVHLRLHGTNAMVLGELVFFCRDHFGWDEPRSLELCAGLSLASTAPGTAIEDMAVLVRDRPNLLELLNDESVGWEELAELDDDFRRAFIDYQERFGQRTIRYDVVDFTLAERPDLTLRLIRDLVRRPSDPEGAARRLAELRDARTREARELLVGRPSEEHDRFERALRRAQTFYPIREERAFHTLNGPLAVLRYALLEAGRRLAERGELAEEQDVFLLQFDEAVASLEGSPVNQDSVRARRDDMSRQRDLEAPLSYGRDPGPPPSFAFLGPAARFAHEAMVWVLDRNFAPDTSVLRQAPGSVLHGFPASVGTYEGPARLVRSEADFSRVRPGDVLLCPITAPPWSVLFPTLGALVTDTGGLLSHPAIIARDFGIPAVVGTGNATELIADGATVRVDGGAGTVELVRA